MSKVEYYIQSQSFQGGTAGTLLIEINVLMLITITMQNSLKSQAN